MIIQAARIAAASGHGRTADHVFAGDANDAIHVLQGSRGDLADMVSDARAAGKRWAIRHYKFSAYEETTRAEALALAEEIAAEFGFDLLRCVIIEHRKPRADGVACGRHWHLLAPEWDPVRRRVLDASWMMPRQEKLGRLAELRLGHAQVKGRWNAVVERALHREGWMAEADAVAPLTAGARPGAAYTAARHQAAERAGISLPHARAALAGAWRLGDTPAACLAVIKELGFYVRRGEKPGVWTVEAAGEQPALLGALHRLVRQPTAAVAAALEEADRPGRDEPVQPGPQAAGAGGVHRVRGVAEGGPARASSEPQRDPASGRGGGRDPGRGAPDPRGAGERRERNRAGAQAAGHDRPDAVPHRDQAERPDIGATGRSRVKGTCPQLGPGRADAPQLPGALTACLGAGPDPDESRRTQELGRREADAEVAALPVHRAIARIPWPWESASSRRERRDAWWDRMLALLAHDALRLPGWVPRGVGDRVIHVALDRERKAVILELVSETRLIDRCDQIDVVGVQDDVTATELVEAIQGQEWDAVELHGGLEFRRAMALLLAALEPPVDVAASTLTEADQLTLARLRRAGTVPGRTPVQAPSHKARERGMDAQEACAYIPRAPLGQATDGEKTASLGCADLCADLCADRAEYAAGAARNSLI